MLTSSVSQPVDLTTAKFEETRSLPPIGLHHYVPRKEDAELEQVVYRQTVLDDSDIRKLKYAVIRGIGGVGKTEMGKHIASRTFQRATKPHLHSFLKVDDDDESQLSERSIGYKFLCRVFVQNHLPSVEWLTLNLNDPKQTLQQLLRRWEEMKPTDTKENIKRVWVVQIDEFQRTQKLVGATLRAVEQWNDPYYLMDAKTGMQLSM